MFASLGRTELGLARLLANTERTSQVIRILLPSSSILERLKTSVYVESNTSGWNQTCKNLIRFLQDRISNKKNISPVSAKAEGTAQNAESEKRFHS